MPIYSYECPQCGESLEVVQSMKAHSVTQDCACGGRLVQQLSAAFISPDIAPYRAVAGDKAGQMITSRREHREFLKRNRFVEVGNEPVKPIKNDCRPRRGEIAQELKRVIPQVLKR